MPGGRRWRSRLVFGTAPQHVDEGFALLNIGKREIAR
jgi:hypothetical protein